METLNKIEVPEYKIFNQRDLSHIGAKRYSAAVIIKADVKYLTREQVREVVERATEELIKSKYYRDDIVAKHFGSHFADVVWLVVVARGKKTPICKTLYINPKLPENMIPSGLSGRVERHKGRVDIVWKGGF